MTSERYVSFLVVGDKVTVVHADVPKDVAEPISIVSDSTWKMQDGDRAAALDALYKRCSSHLAEHPVDQIVVKASAVSTGSATRALLESAESRGVVIAAAAAEGTAVSTLSKATISRTYGGRKVDEYLKDDQFWDDNTKGEKLRKTSREAVMLIVAKRVK